MTDVDDFSAEQLRDAQRECKKADMVFVVSNPCFEVWLVDHMKRCPDGACTPQSTQDLTAWTGCRDRQKHIVAGAVTGRFDIAEANASQHNTPERRVLRARLDSTDFAPRTDMLSAIEALR